MATIPLQQIAVSAAVLGIASHLGYFINGEHHLKGPRYAQAAALLPVVGVVALTRLSSVSIVGAIAAVTVTVMAFYTGLFGSMLVYRGFFHRLGKFSGPPLAKFSKFWHVSRLGGCDNYKHLDRWHQQYGDFVRIGPSELTITDPDAVELLLGNRSKCIKAPWYDLSDPLVSMHNARDKALHDKRRRVWDRGFSMKALEGYESRVTGFTDVLMSKIRGNEGQPMNMSLWFNYYSFDVMGELSFGKSFNMLNSGAMHDAIKYLHEGTRPLGIFSPMPWLMIILSRIPGLSAAFQRFIRWCGQQAEERKNMELAEKDIMSYLLESEPMSNDEFTNQMWLIGDARLVIVAGSDTTAATLTHVWYHLAKNPQIAEALRKEVDPLKKDGALPFNPRDLQEAKYLNGIINEALRLHPPVPSGLSRLTPPEGLDINGTYIPGDTIVSVPFWTLGHSEKAFAKPEEFIPERWTTKPELVKHKDSFAPFSIGRYGCIGKNLALMELRTVTANMISEFDVKFAPGEDGSKLINETEDYFTIGLAALELVFTPRKK